MEASLASTHCAGLPRWCSGKEPACQCKRHKRHGFDPWVGKIPWRGAWQPTPAFLPGESHGLRRLAGYSPWGHRGFTLYFSTDASLASTHEMPVSPHTQWWQPNTFPDIVKCLLGAGCQENWTFTEALLLCTNDGPRRVKTFGYLYKVLKPEVQLIYNSVLVFAVQQTIQVYIFFSRLFSIIVFYKILNIVPCAI